MKFSSKIFLAFLIFAIPPVLHPAKDAVSGEERAYTLKELVDLLHASPSLRKLNAEVEASKRERRVSLTPPNPEFSFERGKARKREGVSEEFLWSDEGNFEISQAIELPPKFLTRKSIWGKELLEKRKLAGSLKLELISELKRLFYETLFLEEKKGIFISNLQGAKRNFAIIESRVKAGEEAPASLLRAKSELIEAYLDTLDASVEVEKSKLEIKQIVGDGILYPFSLLGELESAESPLEREVFFRGLEDSNPLLGRARANLERIRLERRLALLSFLPDLSVGLAREKEVDKSTDFVSFSFELPLFTPLSGLVPLKKAEIEIAQAELEKLESSLGARLEAAILQYETSKKAVLLFPGDLIQFARVTKENAATAYREGEISALELIDTQRAFSELLQNRARSYLRLKLSRIEIEALAGLPLLEERK